MKLFGNTGNGQRTRQAVPVKERPQDKENVLKMDSTIFDIPLDDENSAEKVQPEIKIIEPVKQATQNAPLNSTPQHEDIKPSSDVKITEDEHETEEEIKPFALERGTQDKNNRGIIKGIILLAFSLAVLFVTVFSVFSYLLKSDNPMKSTSSKGKESKPVINTEAVPTADVDIEDAVNAETPNSVTEGIYNLLIVGIDDSDKYTDTVLVLHVDANSHQLSALSLPHNTLIYGDYDVPMLDEVYHNSGKGEKGISALEDKLESMFGFPMDAHIVLNSESFSAMMKAFGTISFDVPETLSSKLEKGTQELDDQTALELLQTKQYKDETIRRERVQLDFLQELGVQKLSSLTHSELEILAKTLSELLDSDLTQENFAYLLLEFQNCDFANLKYYLMPGRIIKYYSRDYHQLDETAMLAILNMSFNPYDEDIDEDDVEIRTEKETDVPQSDYYHEITQNNDDDNNDNNGGGSFNGGGSTGGVEPENNDPGNVDVEPDPDPEPEPDENNPDEP